MNCFNHPDNAAIGVCKACTNGLCHACAADLGYGIACKGSHEARARDLEMIIAKNATAFKDAPKNLYIVPLFYIFMGFLFSGYSLYDGSAVPLTFTVTRTGLGCNFDV